MSPHRTRLLRRTAVAAALAVVAALPVAAPRDDAPAAAASAPAAGLPTSTRVLAISVDGLNPRAITQLGASGAPALHRLLTEGVGTLEARTQVEQTVTLPNHTSMLTGRRIAAARGGHGVTWNEDLPRTTVQAAAGEPVDSIFTTVRAAGGTSALFAGKTKFSLFKRSWRGAVTRFVVDEKMPRLARAARADLLAAERDFTFLHLALPDTAGHAQGFMSPGYLAAVTRTDRVLGRLLATIDADAELSQDLVVVLTADHGGDGVGHADARDPDNYRVPFLVWGAGVAPADLYALNPTLRDPGTRRPGLRGPQPVRNGMVADLAASLLGLPAVPGSTQDADRSLRVTAS